MNTTAEKEVSDLVGCLTDPVIVFPGGWGDSVPEWLKSVIPLERMIVLMESKDGREPTASDAEACAYLMTVSLSQPIDANWTNIYLYLAGKTCKRWKKVEVSSDIAVESLNDHQATLLNRLKDWLYQRRAEGRVKGRSSRQTRTPDLGRKADEQMALFKF
ncbi:MAG: hypothetical protein A2147_03620 [Chloroflexi bacterium RBG_16_57_8]|nr:MAG: hypothetical protein A2147_03620 [Chloroflexi bacterium RBG_16_57_8]